MKFVILATSEFGLSIADAILDSGHQVTAMISMPKKYLPNNSVNIEQYAIQKNISYHEYQDINSLNSVKTLKQFEPDYIFSSWPKIIDKEVLDISKNYCIGTHPAALPFNRGRHPLHWIINLGILETKLSFFKINEGVDTGDIILQYPVKIGKNDTIIDINSMINSAAYDGTLILCKKIISEFTFSGKTQNHKLANYWRMRTPHDVTIDLRMPADLIIKIVHSFTLPYPCANLIYEKCVIKIKEVNYIKTNKSYEEIQRIEPGKIFGIDNNSLTVKAGDKIIELLSIDPIPGEMTSAKYIHPPSMYIMQHDIIFD